MIGKFPILKQKYTKTSNTYNSFYAFKVQLKKNLAIGGYTAQFGFGATAEAIRGPVLMPEITEKLNQNAAAEVLNAEHKRQHDYYVALHHVQYEAFVAGGSVGQAPTAVPNLVVVPINNL